MNTQNTDPVLIKTLFGTGREKEKDNDDITA